jgi:hypothetical protein
VSVTDVIASGPERPEHRRRSPPWLVMLVVAAALAGAVRLWGGVSPPAPATPTALPLPTRVTATPTPTGRPATFRLAGRSGTGPPGLRVLIGGGGTAPGTRPLVVTGAGQAQPLPGVPPSTTSRLTSVQRLPAATVILVQDTDYRRISATVRPDRGPAVQLGPGLDTVVAAHGGGYIGTDTGWNRLPGRLAGYSPTGRLRWQRPLTTATLVHRDTPYGLLVQVVADPENSTSGALALVDARSGHLLHGIGATEVVLASTDRKVAWIPAGCGDWPAHCTLAVTDLRTRQDQFYDLPAGRRPSIAAFSPNETMLALSFAGEHTFIAHGDPDGYVSVLSLVTGQSQRMPGLTTRAKQAPALAWAPDAQLVLGVNVDDELDRLLLWSPGQPGPVVLPATLPPYSAAVYLAVLPS